MCGTEFLIVSRHQWIRIPVCRNPKFVFPWNLAHLEENNTGTDKNVQPPATHLCHCGLLSTLAHSNKNGSASFASTWNACKSAGWSALVQMVAQLCPPCPSCSAAIEETQDRSTSSFFTSGPMLKSYGPEQSCHSAPCTLN